MNSTKSIHPVTLIKIGGSVVTDKRKNQFYRKEQVQRVLQEIAQFYKDANELLIIGHGQGSYAHPIVKANLSHFESKQNFNALTMAQMLRVISNLHEQILEDMIEQSLPATSFRFNQQAILKGSSFSSNTSLLTELLDSKVIPVTTGDIVMDYDKGNAVLSTEKIFFHLVQSLFQTQRFEVTRIVYITEVAGLLNAEGVLIPKIGAEEVADEGLFFSDSTQSDVTGAMKHKIESAQQLARQGIPVAILSPNTNGNIYNYLSGKDWVGTLIQ